MGNSSSAAQEGEFCRCLRENVTFGCSRQRQFVACRWPAHGPGGGKSNRNAARKLAAPGALVDSWANSAGRQRAGSSAPVTQHTASLTGWEGATELGGVVQPGTLFPCVCTRPERNSLGLYGRSLWLHSSDGKPLFPLRFRRVVFRILKATLTNLM